MRIPVPAQWPTNLTLYQTGTRRSSTTGEPVYVAEFRQAKPTPKDSAMEQIATIVADVFCQFAKVTDPAAKAAAEKAATSLLQAGVDVYTAIKAAKAVAAATKVV